MLLRKRRWLTFMFALIPGVGHLYLGFSKMGLQFMTAASLCIIFSISLPNIFPFALAILWFYQMFDALQKAAWMKLAWSEQQRMMYENHGLAVPWRFDFSAIPGFPQDRINPVMIGASSVVAGILLLLITTSRPLWIWLTNYNIGTILLALGLVGFGFWMLRANRVPE
ncbi:hypothetical protein EBB07_33380 [Paenibacillaceae bacterium]|nr:hypothetical protein EBB07_33380 [Paenibacillaceae bacterium]